MKFGKAKWTKKTPNVQGWYWAIQDFDESYVAEIVNVIVSSGKLCALSTETDEVEELDNWDYWLGPLDVPKPPWE